MEVRGKLLRDHIICADSFLRPECSSRTIDCTPIAPLGVLYSVQNLVLSPPHSSLTINQSNRATLSCRRTQIHLGKKFRPRISIETVPAIFLTKIPTSPVPTVSPPHPRPLPRPRRSKRRSDPRNLLSPVPVSQHPSRPPETPPRRTAAARVS